MNMGFDGSMDAPEPREVELHYHCINCEETIDADENGRNNGLCDICEESENGFIGDGEDRTE